MAKREAKKLADYEEEFAKENPGKLPDYTATLKKIRLVLLLDRSPEPIPDTELSNCFPGVGKISWHNGFNRKHRDRKARTLEKLKDLPGALSKLADTQRNSAGITAERDRLKGLLESCEKSSERARRRGPRQNLGNRKTECRHSKRLQAKLKVAMDELGDNERVI
jgi:hypothetical protein